MFDQFYHSIEFPESLTSFFIALIHKVEYHLVLGNFRLISLVDSLYKMLVKVLVSRFLKVMGNIISQEQLTFLKGRQLVDGLVALNKDLDLAKLSKQEYFFRSSFQEGVQFC